MEYRQLGGSGLQVPVLSFGTATFAGGTSEGAWGNTQVAEATRLVGVSSLQQVCGATMCSIHRRIVKRR